MPPDQQPASAEVTPTEIGSVIEFGADEAAPRRPRGPRFSVSAWASGMAADRRLVPLAAALGGVALFASLISEWQVTDVDATLLGDGQVGTKPLPTTVADLGAWGGGYLAGLFVLVAAAVLVLFGPAPGRRYARLVGLSAGGVLIGVLAALGAELGNTSRTLGEVFMVQLNQNQVQLSYGRGLWCALFGVAATMLALILAGRHLLPPADDVSVPAADEEQAAEVALPVWSWRRPRSAEEDEDERQPDEPFDLTVSSAKPFTPSTDDRDKPN
ncbi:MAG TPA: hypothetical protein VGP57_15120 [Actinoplanes sp.]|jgi:hypothetical protein|nr:hypothetical protein [Actinoplanes sp.]